MEWRAATAIALGRASIAAVLRRRAAEAAAAGGGAGTAAQSVSDAAAAEYISRHVYAPRFGALVAAGTLRAPRNCPLAPRDSAPLVAALAERLARVYVEWIGPDLAAPPLTPAHASAANAADDAAVDAIALGNWLESLGAAAVEPLRLAHFVRCAAERPSSR